jgi:hypothetical protein
LAERGVLHFTPENMILPSDTAFARTASGYPRHGMGKSQLATDWEIAADTAISPNTEGNLMRQFGRSSGTTLQNNPWLAKVTPETPVYSTGPLSLPDVEFGHLIDELRNATRADSDLPANLRWKPEDLKKVTVPQAVERVAKINEWRAAQKAEADAAKARNPATFTFKEYPEKGMQWVELKAPNNETMPLEERKALIKKLQAEGRSPATWPRETLEEALKYEGDVMGHCVGGYCPDVLEGKSRIYSLRDKKGEPHVTIEVGPATPEMGISKLPSKERAEFLNEVKQRHFGGRNPNMQEQQRFFDLLEKEYLAKYGEPPADIVQIKGKGNRAPKEEYLPMVQDFVKSGKWGSIGDYGNTKLRERAEMFDAIDLNKLKAAGHDVPEHLTTEEAKSFADKLYTIETGKNPETGQAYARGGLVTDTDAIAAKLKATGMDDQKAFMQALRMADARQEAHMAFGGFVKLGKGAKAADEATKVAKPVKAAAKTEDVEKVAKPAKAEAPKPVAGPQAKALETARKNAVKMLGLPKANTPQERAKAMGYVPDVSGELYRGSHQAPTASREYSAPAFALDNLYPEDVYSSKAARYYGHGSDPAEDAELMRRLQRVRSHPDEPMVIFRAVPKDAPDTINHGDWVTLSKKYAIEHGEGRFGDDYKIVRDRVPAKTLFTDGNSIYEFGYDKTQKFAEGPASLPVMRSPVEGRRERSRFAAFDPARSSENDLLGAADPALLAGVAVGSGLGIDAIRRIKKEEQKPEEQKKARGGLAKRV